MSESKVESIKLVSPFLRTLVGSVHRIRAKIIENPGFLALSILLFFERYVSLLLVKKDQLMKWKNASVIF